MKNDLPGTTAVELDALLRAQKAAWLREPYPLWETRATHLKALRRMLLAQKASQAFIAAPLVWVSSKLPPTMACRRCSALPSGRARKRLKTASRSWAVMSRMVASSRPFLSLK